MSQYRTRPILVEAVQFDPSAAQWPDGVIAWGLDNPDDGSWGYVRTRFGTEHVFAQDWIVVEPSGKRYLFKDDVFRASYEPVGENSVDLEEDAR